MWQSLAVVMGIMLFFVCSSMAQTDSPAGVEGVITMSPARPGPTRLGVPDSAPLANVTFVVRNDSDVVATFTTDAEGMFRVPLVPGHYSVTRKDGRSGIGRYGPFEVDVTAGRMTKVEWRCDSGMR
jgi:Prealbumin-like fold domain